MNCQKFEELVNDIARAQMIDAGVRDAALSHRDGCESCATRLEDEQAVTLGLRELADSTEADGAPARVEAFLLNAFAESAPIQLIPQVSARRYQAKYLIGSIAAGLLIVFGASVVRWRQTAQVTQDTTATMIASKVPVGPSIIVNSPPPILERNIPAPLVSVHKSPKVNKAPLGIRPATVNNSTEIATDFMPLTYGATSNLQEGGRMVRVELPHSALATFGLPVNMDRANERVKADVLYGVDGLAQAIRFVR